MGEIQAMAIGSLLAHLEARGVDPNSVGVAVTLCFHSFIPGLETLKVEIEQADGGFKFSTPVSWNDMVIKSLGAIMGAVVFEYLKAKKEMEEGQDNG